MENRTGSRLSDLEHRTGSRLSSIGNRTGSRLSNLEGKAGSCQSTIDVVSSSSYGSDAYPMDLSGELKENDPHVPSATVDGMLCAIQDQTNALRRLRRNILTK